MKRWASILLVTAIVSVFFLFSENIRNCGPQNPAEEKITISNEDECDFLCKKLNECELNDLFDDCGNYCESTYTKELKECIYDNNCDAIEIQCFSAKADIPDCVALCEILEKCAKEPFEECISECPDFDKEKINCISKTECDSIVEECLEENKEKRCDLFCTQLVDCEIIGPSDFWTCKDICLDEEKALIDCVLNSSCNQVDRWCFGVRPQISCGMFCDHLTDCGYWEADSYALCMEECNLESQSLVDCVIHSECVIAELCYENPWSKPECGEYCEKLIDCNLLEPWDFVECLEECIEEPADNIWCVMNTSCAHIAHVCWDNPYQDDCANACDKMVECRFGLPFEECFALCIDLWSADTPVCILESTCDLIEDGCFQPAFKAECANACRKMMECNLMGEQENCHEDCFENWSEEKVECVRIKSCGDISASCL